MPEELLECLLPKGTGTRKKKDEQIEPLAF